MKDVRVMAKEQQFKAKEKKGKEGVKSASELKVISMNLGAHDSHPRGFGEA